VFVVVVVMTMRMVMRLGIIFYHLDIFEVVTAILDLFQRLLRAVAVHFLPHKVDQSVGNALNLFDFFL
jgi:hypothetical protein